MIAALWGRFAGWIVAVGAVLGLLAATWAGGRTSGTHSARTRAIEAELHARETRDEVDRAVARQPDPAQQLRDRWSRD